MQELKLYSFPKIMMHTDILEVGIFFMTYSMCIGTPFKRLTISALKGGTILKPRTEYCLTLGTAIIDLLQDFHTNTLLFIPTILKYEIE